MNYLLLIIVAVVSFTLGRKSMKTFTPKSAERLDSIRAEAHEALSERTEKRKERILEFMRKEKEHQNELIGCNLEAECKGVTCNNIEKLLDVSEQTAHKYLNELEKEQKIEQIGEVGRGVYYTLKQ